MRGEQHRTRAGLFADVVLGAALASCLGALAHTLAPRMGTWGWRSAMLAYVSAALAGLALFTISPRFNQRSRVTTATVVSSVAFSLYLLELLLFCARLGGGWAAGAAQRIGVNLDPREKWEVVDELRMQGVDAIPLVTPHNLFAYDGFDPEEAGMLPLTGISGKMTVLCNESGYYAEYVADEHGFNNPRGLHKSGAVDIALIGDSFVQGYCVHPGEDVPGQLRSAGFRALNLGVGGSGPLLELAVLTEYALFYPPRVVLWFYFENDDDELAEEDASSILRKYLIPGFDQNLRNRQPQVDRVLTDFLVRTRKFAELRPQASSGLSSRLARTLAELTKLKHLRTFLRQRHSAVVTIPIISPTQEFEHVLAAARDRVRAAGARLYFVYLPSLDTFVAGETKYRVHRDEVLAAVSALGIDTIDFLVPLRIAREPPPEVVPGSHEGAST